MGKKKEKSTLWQILYRIIIGAIAAILLYFGLILRVIKEYQHHFK